MSIWKRLFGDRSASPSDSAKDETAPFLVFLAGTGIERQRISDAVAEWKGNHDSSFTANIDLQIGRNPSGDVVMISTRINGSANHSRMQADLESIFQARGIALEPKAAKST